MKTRTKTRANSLSEVDRQSRRRERFLSKTHANGNIQRFVREALNYLHPEQIEELIKILMQFSSSSRHLQDGIITAEELLHVFTKDTSQGAFISSSASETHEQSSFHFIPLSEGDSHAVVAAAKDRIAVELQRKLTLLFSEQLDTQVHRIVERVRRGDLSEIPLPADGKDAIRKRPYGKQTRAAEMSDKIQQAIARGEHPGKFIFRELIEPSKQTLQTLATEIGVHYNSLTYLKTEQTALSPEMAAKLSHHFRTHSTLKHTYSTQELLSLQSAIDAKKADQSLQKQLASLPEKKDPTPV